MPSFFTKVFGRKKDEKEPAAHHKRHSQPSLLEGKYEAVSPHVSPSVTNLSDPSSQQQSSKDNTLSFQRSRSRPVSDQSRQSNVPSIPTPQLTLNLPVPKEEKSRSLGVVFEADPENINALPEEVIGERRLNPLEALILVKACSSAIIDKGGLETLGLMHPHWYSASPEVQRKLISLFILSLGPKSPITTLSPSSASPSAMFETELKYTRDPHDVASVLTWALRHLRLEGSSFGSKGSTPSEWTWYADFATSERDGGYPSTAFSKSLTPSLPPTHIQLLGAILDTMSSLAAHAEANGTSGSKLARLFGLWLFSTERAQADDDWAAFYQRWERAGRILEHLFLAHVREEVAASKMPLRLAELVKHYPYHNSHEKDASDNADDLPYLPLPRFSTRKRDAVFVRLDTLLPSPDSETPAREHPLHLLTEALKTAPESDTFASEQAQSLWEEIKAKASEGVENQDTSPSLRKVLDDETLRLLSLISGETPNASVSSSPFDSNSSPSSPALLVPESARLRSASVGNPSGNGKLATSNGHGRTPTTSSPTNWADFSTAGFGESAFDKNLALTIADDIEVTEPPRTIGRAKSPLRGRRSSVDNPSPLSPTTTNETKLKPTLSRIEIVEVDEAFYDFWSDALLDPIASSWPAFLVCQLKGVKTSLLVVEQTYTRPAPPPPPPTTQQEPTTRRAASPRPSVSASVGSGRKSFTFSPTIKRFSFFSSNDGASKTTSKKSGAGARPASRTPKIGEMGEVLEEEPTVTRVQTAPAATEKPVPAPPVKKPSPELPAVPLVDAPPVVTEIAPVATEPVKAEGETPEKPTAVVPEDIVVPKDQTPVAEANHAEKELPAAPEGVVLTGSTPGPQAALESSEMKTLVQAQEETKEPEAAVTEPEAPAQEELVPAVAEPEVPAREEPVAAVPEPEAHPVAAQPEPEVSAVQDPIAVEPTHQEAVAEPVTTFPPGLESTDAAPAAKEETQTAAVAEETHHDDATKEPETAAPAEDTTAAQDPEPIVEPSHIEEPTSAAAASEQVVHPVESAYLPVDQASEPEPLVENVSLSVPVALGEAPAEPEHSDATVEPPSEPAAEPAVVDKEPEATVEAPEPEEQKPEQPVVVEETTPEEPSEPVAAPVEPSEPTAEEPQPTIEETTATVEPSSQVPEKAAPTVEDVSAAEAEEKSHANGNSHAAEASGSTVANESQEPESLPAEEPHA